MGVREVLGCIKRNKNFLITTHRNPEGDALGSELAMSKLLRSMGKRVVVANEDEVPYEYKFLPAVNTIRRFKEKLGKVHFDCSIILDCSDLKRCGDMCSVNLVNKPIINIDHHISNDYFGDINWVNPNASACSEMIHRLYEELGVCVDKQAALLLYTGIMTDTGSFRYSNTTELTHHVAACLVSKGIDVSGIYNRIYGNIPFQDARLLLRILPSMKLMHQGKIAWFEIRRILFKNRKPAFDLTENILSFGRSIKDVEVVVLFREYLDTKNRVRVNLRSQGKIDVNKIARFFGGGGHKTASGCTISGRIDRVRDTVLKRIRRSFLRRVLS